MFIEFEMQLNFFIDKQPLIHGGANIIASVTHQNKKYVMPIIWDDVPYVDEEYAKAMEVPQDIVDQINKYLQNDNMPHYAFIENFGKEAPKFKWTYST